MRQYLFSYNYLMDENNRVKELYNKIKNNISLTNEELLYLNKEKEYILLLSKIDIQYKPSALNTETNIIADTIINYMNWELLDVKIRNKKLKELTNDLVEDYSMLGSYSDDKNEKQLSEFNKKTKGKTKLMFVMNKLNEGVHADDVKGIIWLRPLDEKSRILYFQQLGRCIHSFKPGTTIEEKDRPVVLDLVNNTLKVKLNKDILKEKEDLNSLNNLINWIEINNKIPSIDSNNEVEVINAKILRRIQRKYIKYIKDDSLLEDLKLESKILIEEIINKGIEIDLWNINIPKSNNDNNNKDLDEEDNDKEGTLFNLFKIKPIFRNFIDIVNEVNLYDSHKFDYYYSLLVKLKEQGEDVNLAVGDKLDIKEDGTIIVVKKVTKRIDGKQIIINSEIYNNPQLIRVGDWLYRNKINFDEPQKQKLGDIGYVLSDEEDKFDYYYSLLVKLKEQGEDVNLSADDKLDIKEDETIIVVKKVTKRIDGKQIIINPEIYNNKKLIPVGDWFWRNQTKFDDPQKQRLRDIGYVLRGEENLFEKYYGYLVKLKEQGGDVNLSADDKLDIKEDGTISVVKKERRSTSEKRIISNSEIYNNPKLISVGKWFYKNQPKFDDPQKQRLRDIGYLLRGEENLFEKYYGYLVKLKEQGEDVNLSTWDKLDIKEDGTISVVKKERRSTSEKRIISNSEIYNNPKLISVGNWFYKNQPKFDDPQKQRLRDIGYVLSGEKNKFEEYYGYLIKLKEQGEDVNLSAKDKLDIKEDGTITVVKNVTKRIDGKKIIINSEIYNNKKLIPVGNWFYLNQSIFNKTQKQKLRDIGYVLKEDKKKKKNQKQEEFDEVSNFGKKQDEILNKKEHQHGK